MPLFDSLALRDGNSQKGAGRRRERRGSALTVDVSYSSSSLLGRSSGTNATRALLQFGEHPLNYQRMMTAIASSSNHRPRDSLLLPLPLHSPEDNDDNDEVESEEEGRNEEEPPSELRAMQKPPQNDAAIAANT